MAKKKKEKEFEYVYNPVKEQIGGKNAERVIWSTKSLNIAVDAISKGLPLKANPFCGKNVKLIKPDLVYRRTPEEIQDFIRCKEDPVYFGEKCYLMTPKGLQQCKLRDYQVKYLKHLVNNRFSIYRSCRQAGKSVVTGIYVLWKTLFSIDNNALILSKSGPAGIDLVKKIKDMYLNLPYHLKAGTMKWNQSECSFDNNCSFKTEAFGPTAGLGSTINTLILDEFAWCPPNDVELFYENIIPTVTTMTNSNVCIMSTQNGYNKFYKIWQGAITKENIYAPFNTDWYEVPQYNPKTDKWEPRTKEWKDMMVGVLGSEQAFNYQYGTQFLASDHCLLSRECISVIRDNVILFENRGDELESLTMLHPDYLVWDPRFDLNQLRTGYFLILVDLAEGGGGDYTVFNIMQVISKDELSQVGFYRTNKVGLEDVALDFWLMCPQLFSPDHYVVSIEWNTYGGLFYKELTCLNEDFYRPEFSARFNIVQEFDVNNIAHYKKGNQEEEAISLGPSIKKAMVPGIRFTAQNKKTACAIMKMSIEKFKILINDLVTISEFENFEDKNGNGSYKAAFGHDDIAMTFAQIPMVQNTARWKEFIEDATSGAIALELVGKYDENYTYPHEWNPQSSWLPQNMNQSLEQVI